MPDTESFIPYIPFQYSEREMLRRSEKFYQYANRRRTIREFSDKSVPRKVIENIIRTAGTAPSGANLQPWTFVTVSDQSIKHKIRLAAEAVEKKFYEERISDEQREDLEPIGTTWQKPYLEIAPYLIVVFRQDYGWDEQTQKKKKHFYVKESVGIAMGLLIAAIHNAGLVTVSHTPTPMKFLSEILERPKNEKAYVLFPVGYPAKGVKVPNITRKGLSDIMVWK